MSRAPRIWVLLGQRRGDNLQLLALAEALGLPFETRTIAYNQLRRIPNRLLGASLASVTAGARRWLEPPWPDLVLGAGFRSVAVARFIRKQSGGRTKLVRFGNPRLPFDKFDLVITPPQYADRGGPNALRLPLAMASPHSGGSADDEERAFLDRLPRPHRLLVLGGSTRLWQLTAEDCASAAQQLVDKSRDDGGTAIAVGSPRTAPELIDAVQRVFEGTGNPVVRGRTPRYATLIADADELHVTADSVSMLSEAVFTGKPVGMIPVRPAVETRARYLLARYRLARPPFPDLRKVWTALEDSGAVGTVAEPRQGRLTNPVRAAADAVLALLGR